MHLFERAAVADEASLIHQIPVIDCAPLLGDEHDTEAVAAVVLAIRSACENVGFFYIKGHGVREQIVEDCFAASREFHALPLDEKLKLRQDENNIGYMPINHSITASDEIHKTTHPNQNASFFVGHDRPPTHPDVIGKVPMRGANQWPEDWPEFRLRVMAYFDALQRVAGKLVPALAMALGLERSFFDAAFSNEPYIELRLLHSPPQPDVSDEKFNVAPHTDQSFITLLARQPEEKPALAVRLKNGEWFKAPIIPGTFLVNLGNVMRRYSNGEFMSTPHGVINESGADRFSIAFFYSPNPDTVIEPVPNKISRDRPARFEAIRYGDMASDVHKKNYGRFRPAVA